MTSSGYKIKDKVTKNSKKQLKEVTDKAKSLKTEIEILKQDGEANRKKLDAKTEECKKEITAFRREINKILDKMEKEMLATLDKSQINSCKRQRSELQH